MNLNMPNGIHNGNLTLGDKRNAIIEGIAHGQSVASIAKRLHCSPRVIVAIREMEWQKVSDRKSVLAAQSERIATLAADRLTQELESNRPICPTALVPIYGVAVDKLMAMRGDSISTVRHIHSLELSDQDIVAFAVQRSKTVQATVVNESPPNYPRLEQQPDETIAPATKRRQKLKRQRDRGATDSQSAVLPKQA